MLKSPAMLKMALQWVLLITEQIYLIKNKLKINQMIQMSLNRVKNAFSLKVIEA